MNPATIHEPLHLPLPLLKEFASLLGLSPHALGAQVAAEDLRMLPGGRRAISRAAAGTLLREALHSRHGPAGPGPLALINLKGGVGKTTLAIHFAMRASQFGLRVCVLDLDPQASSTLALIGEPEEETPVFLDVWQDPAAGVPTALRAVTEGLDLLPSSLDNTLLDGQLAHPTQQKRAVRGVCETLQELGYDLVIVDCPPALGTAVISTLCAVRQLVVPVCADAFSFKGLQLTLDEMLSIGDTFALPPPRVRVVFNRHDKRERLHAEALARLRERHGEALLDSVLRVSSQYARALAAGQSVFTQPRQAVAASDLDACLRELFDLHHEPVR